MKDSNLQSLELDAHMTYSRPNCLPYYVSSLYTVSVISSTEHCPAKRSVPSVYLGVHICVLGSPSLSYDIYSASPIFQLWSTTQNIGCNLTKNHTFHSLNNMIFNLCLCSEFAIIVECVINLQISSISLQS